MLSVTNIEKVKNLKIGVKKFSFLSTFKTVYTTYIIFFNSVDPT